ncbi:MAG: tRNA (N(6)-L-threonylcarbamoyladenosine(37)-C(2))-methylthiotransferase MtaB, partial [Gemmatimonadetes bacterium]|nr:tRNA (N(6)-L-threonylcarbamoyladenosine(37)-C(2))-methylthiotransferase MtaB [Gemmatimonadota bacterium]
MRLHFKTFGCKANQYDTERMRQAVGAGPAALEDADVCVVNTCTVTNAADAGARRFIRRAARVNPGVRIVVAGCSAVLRAGDYRRMAEVDGVVAGHDPGAVRDAVLG